MHFASRHRHTWRLIKSGAASAIALLSAVVVIAPLGFVFFYLVEKGASSVNWSFFTELPKPVGVVGGGMANAIVGSGELLGLAALIGMPIGVFVGVYLAGYGSARGEWILRSCDDWLNV